MSRRHLMGLAIALVGLVTAVTPAGAQSVFYESATLGPIGQGGGFSLTNSQFLGSRFVVSTPVTISAVGGHLDVPNPSLFAAIVSFPGLVPGAGGSHALNGTGTVIHATVTFAAGSPSNDFIIPLGTPLTLNPIGDTYALIFGSGLFSATGGGAMPANNTDTVAGTGSYFFASGGDSPGYVWNNGGFNNTRFVLYTAAVPEPATAILVGLGLASTGLATWRLRRRRRRRRK